MHPKRTARRFLPWAAVLTVGLLALTSSRAQPPDKKDVKDPKADAPLPAVKDKEGTVVVPLGGIRTFDAGLKEPPTSVTITREDILGYREDPNDGTKLQLIGKASGLTQLVIGRKGLADLRFNVSVEPDLTQLRNVIKRTVPTATVEVSAAPQRVAWADHGEDVPHIILT
jgi:Flp pilus assembly secretin CpaC